MSQHLTIELSDEVYSILQHQADAISLSVTDWIITKLGNSDIDQNFVNFDQDFPENHNWEIFALNNLNKCYSEDEPIYDLTHIKENNLDY